MEDYGTIQMVEAPIRRCLLKTRRGSMITIEDGHLQFTGFYDYGQQTRDFWAEHCQSVLLQRDCLFLVIGPTRPYFEQALVRFPAGVAEQMRHWVGLANTMLLVPRQVRVI